MDAFDLIVKFVLSKYWAYCINFLVTNICFMVTIFVAVYDRDPLENWCKGRFCLIGDAAHAMSPFAGQGANMAVIDGFLIATMVLSELKKASLTTSGSVPTEKINQEFKDFEKIRKLLHQKF